MTKETTTETTPEEETQEVDTKTEEEVEAESEEKVEKEPSQDIYKEELEKERKAREKAEKKAADLAFKIRDNKRKKDNEAEDEEDDDDKPLTASEFQALLAKDRAESRKEMTMIQAETKIKSLAKSESEAELMTDLFKNRQFPEHYSLDDQIEEVYVIANRKKLVSERNEAMRGLQGKNGVNNDGSTTHHDPLRGKQPQLSAQDKQVIVNELGYKYNNTSKQWEKKLDNGTILVRNNETGEVKKLS